MLLLIAAVTMAHADNLSVGGVTVDLTKSGYITGSTITGTVYYDASQKRLDLTNATITSSSIGINADVSPGNMDFRVYLSGKNIINTTGRVSLRADKNIMLCGNGDLELNGPGNFINQCKLTVYACRVTVNSTGNDGFHSMPNGNADLTLAYHGALKISCNSTALQNFNNITYTTGQILSGGASENQMMIGDDYDLEIGGEKVTPFNRDNVTGSKISGKVSVAIAGMTATSYSNLKVTLNNATVSGSNYGFYYSDTTRPIDIILTGTNTINATTRGITGFTGINCKEIRITGSGSDKLTVTAATGIINQGDLSVKDCILDINGSYTGISLNDTGKLTVDNATLHSKTTSSSGKAIYQLTGVEYLHGCTETEPLRSGYNTTLKGIANTRTSSTALLREVTIEPTYGIVVCGQIMKKSMGNTEFPITGDGIKGTVTYDPKQNYLNLKGSAELGLLGGKYNSAAIEVLDFNNDIGASNPELTIWSNGSGSNKISDLIGNSRANAICCNNDISIQGNTPLDIVSMFGVYLPGARKVTVGLKADLSVSSYNCAISSNTSGMKIQFTTERTDTFTYRFRGETGGPFSDLASLTMGGFSILSPSGAYYDSSSKGIIYNGTREFDKWVVFGSPSYANNYGLQIADNDPIIMEKLYYPSPGRMNYQCNQFYNTWRNEQHDVCHIFTTKEDAVLSEGTHLLPWDGSVDLASVLSVHGNKGGNRDQKIDMQANGWQWAFELEDYDITQYDPEAMWGTADENKYAWLKGNLLTACYVTNGERDTGKQSRSSIGRKPLLKVQLLDEEGEVLTEGYMLFTIGDLSSLTELNVEMKLSELSEISSATGSEYRIEWYMMEEKIVDKIRKETDDYIAKGEFESNYCYSTDVSYSTEYYGMTIREIENNSIYGTVSDVRLRPFINYRGKWIPKFLLPMLEGQENYFDAGQFSAIFSELNSHLSWTLTQEQLESLGDGKVAVRLYNPDYYRFPIINIIFSLTDDTKGDVNGDGKVDVADIATVLSIMAGTNTTDNGDVNGDGKVDVADIATILTIMAAS